MNCRLASLIVNIASNAMLMQPQLVADGQLLGLAATRLLATLANVTRIVPAFQHQTDNMAVEGFQVTSPLYYL